MSVECYRKRRDMIPFAELAPHSGKWAAFSCDGARVLASSESLEGLETAVRAAGADPHELVYEFVEANDLTVTGAELQ
jgi:hypothetical protein